MSRQGEDNLSDGDEVDKSDSSSSLCMRGCIGIGYEYDIMCETYAHVMRSCDVCIAD